MWRGRDRKKKSYFSLVLHMIHLTSKYFHSCEIQSQNPGRGTQVGRSIYIYNILSVSRKIDTLSFLTVWIQTFGWWICHFPSVPHIQYKFSVVFNKRDGEHFHSSPFLVQMPALSTVLAKKKVSIKPNHPLHHGRSHIQCNTWHEKEHQHSRC